MKEDLIDIEQVIEKCIGYRWYLFYILFFWTCIAFVYIYFLEKPVYTSRVVLRKLTPLETIELKHPDFSILSIDSQSMFNVVVQNLGGDKLYRSFYKKYEKLSQEDYHDTYYSIASSIETDKLGQKEKMDSIGLNYTTHNISHSVTFINRFTQHLLEISSADFKDYLLTLQEHNIQSLTNDLSDMVEIGIQREQDRIENLADHLKVARDLKLVNYYPLMKKNLVNNTHRTDPVFLFTLGTNALEKLINMSKDRQKNIKPFLGNYRTKEMKLKKWKTLNIGKINFTNAVVESMASTENIDKATFSRKKIAVIVAMLSMASFFIFVAVFRK